MGDCELCGHEGNLISAIVEGALLRICPRCKEYGDVVSIPKPKSFKRVSTKPLVKEPEETIAQDFAIQIKRHREKEGLTQKELGENINEKESFIHQLESGHLTPSLVQAQKFERFFHITLIENIEPYDGPKKVNINFKDKGVTIGDLIKVKRKT